MIIRAVPSNYNDLRHMIIRFAQMITSLARNAPLVLFIRKVESSKALCYNSIMKENKLLEKAQRLAVEIINISSALKSIGQKSLADQIQRSGTSISANIAEGNHPQSRADMVSKFEIALKEANETENWLIVTANAHLLDKEMIENVHKQLIQIKILLISSIRTLKSKS